MASDLQRLQWRINQNNKRNRDWQPKPLSQTPQAIYMRAYRRRLK